MQFQIHENDDSCQPSPQYSNPRIVVREHHGAPLLNWSGLVLVRQLIERLGIVSAIDRSLRLLRRCKWYRESDHILTLIYNILGGGNTLQDCEIHFEEVYSDIIDRAYLPPLRETVDDTRSGIVKCLETALGGSVTVAGEEFFLKNDDGDMEFTLLASGGEDRPQHHRSSQRVCAN